MAQKVVGIDIGSDSIKATFAETSFRSFSVIETREIPVPSPEEFPTIQLKTLQNALETEGISEGKDFPGNDPDQEPDQDQENQEQAVYEPIPPYVYGVAKFLKQPGVYFDECAVTMPGSMVSTHVIDVPFVSTKQIDQIISMEMENYVPFDVSEMVIDYQVLSSDESSSRLLVGLVKKTDLAKFLEYMEMAGLDPSDIDIGPNCIALAAGKTSLPEDEEETIILHIGADQSDLTMIKDGGIVGLRSMPVGSNHIETGGSQMDLTLLTRRLIQTVQGIRLEFGVPIKSMMISGSLAGDSHFRDALSDKLGIELALFRPFEGEFEKSFMDDDRTNAVFAKSLGLVLNLTSAAVKDQLNLRKGEYAFRSSGGMLKEEIKRFAIMGSILLVLLIYNMGFAHVQNRQETELVRQQITEIFEETFDSEASANPVLEFKNNMEMVFKKYKLVGYLGKGDLRSIDIIKMISENMPKDVKVDIKKFDLTQDRLTLEGNTVNFQAVDKIEEALKKVKVFIAIKRDSATTAANQSVKFKFVIRLAEKADSGFAAFQGLKPKGGK